MIFMETSNSKSGRGVKNIAFIDLERSWLRKKQKKKIKKKTEIFKINIYFKLNYR